MNCGHTAEVVCDVCQSTVCHECWLKSILRCPYCHQEYIYDGIKDHQSWYEALVPYYRERITRRETCARRRCEEFFDWVHANPIEADFIAGANDFISTFDKKRFDMIIEAEAEIKRLRERYGDDIDLKCRSGDETVNEDDRMRWVVLDAILGNDWFDAFARVDNESLQSLMSLIIQTRRWFKSSRFFGIDSSTIPIIMRFTNQLHDMKIDEKNYDLIESAIRMAKTSFINSKSHRFYPNDTYETCYGVCERCDEPIIKRDGRYVCRVCDTETDPSPNACALCGYPKGHSHRSIIRMSLYDLNKRINDHVHGIGILPSVEPSSDRVFSQLTERIKPYFRTDLVLRLSQLDSNDPLDYLPLIFEYNRDYARMQRSIRKLMGVIVSIHPIGFRIMHEHGYKPPRDQVDGVDLEYYDKTYIEVNPMNVLRNYANLEPGEVIEYKMPEWLTYIPLKTLTRDIVQRATLRVGRNRINLSDHTKLTILSAL